MKLSAKGEGKSRRQPGIVSDIRGTFLMPNERNVQSVSHCAVSSQDDPSLTPHTSTTNHRQAQLNPDTVGHTATTTAGMVHLKGTPCVHFAATGTAVAFITSADFAFSNAARGLPCAHTHAERSAAQTSMQEGAQPSVHMCHQRGCQRGQRSAVQPELQENAQPSRPTLASTAVGGTTGMALAA